MTSAIAGLKANMTGLDVTGNNVSNVNTDAFKSSSVGFRDSMYQELSSGSASGSAAGINPSQIGYGATASSVDVNTTKGGQDATGDQSNIYINGSGYLVISNKNAGVTSADLKYTRLGKLGTDSGGYLTDGDGNFVCNATTADGSTTFTPIKLTIVSGKPITDLSIGSDGKITYNNGSGTQQTAGPISLAVFPNAAGLQQAGGSCYNAAANAGTPVYVQPGDNGSNTLVPGALEGSNVDLATEFSNMIMYERGYQANTKIVTVADECLQTLVNMK